MGIPIISLLPKLLKAVASITGLDKLADAGNLLETAQIPPEKQAELELATLEFKKEMRGFDLEEVKQMVNESVAMITSPDKYTSRARPTMLYAATAITSFLVIVVGVTIFKAVHIDLGAIGAIVSLMTPLWGAGGFYIYKRTQEKLNGSNDG